MKTILMTGLLLFATVGCKPGNVRTNPASIPQTDSYTLRLNTIGTDFIATFQKKNQLAAYQHLAPSLQAQLPLSDFRRVNAKQIEYYGSVTSFKRADKPMRGVRVSPDGRNEEDVSMWFPVKTTKYPSGAIRLKISFNRDVRNPKIVRYTFMRPKGG